MPIEENFIDKIHKEKNKNFVNSFYSLNNKVTGESINSKINRLVAKIKSNNKKVSFPWICIFVFVILLKKSEK